MDDNEYQELLSKYKKKVAEEFGTAPEKRQKVSSREYDEFKKELFPAHYSAYERLCSFSAKFLKVKPDPKKAAAMQKDIDSCHLKITPSGALSFAIVAAMLVVIVGAVGGFAISVAITPAGDQPSVFIPAFLFLAGLILFPMLQRLPGFLANSWRMKTSSQMVQSIFYMVTYMRHTSNLERAIEFAADHLDDPLSLDFRKILWDVETEKFSNIRDSANFYLEGWKDYDKEFVEAFHLVESSLFESSDQRRLSLLDKSLEVILNGTYENMLHYAHNLKSPMTMLHMLGIILPILGLVILPLVVSFLSEGITPIVMAIYISLLYNVTLPLGVFFLGKIILSKRPAGYGQSDITKKAGVKKYASVNIPLGKKLSIRVNPLYFSIMIVVVAFIIGFSPVFFHSIGTTDFDLIPGQDFKMLGYVCPPDNVNCGESEKFGPYGMGASIMSLIFVFGLGLAVGLFFFLRSKNVIEIRKKTLALEDEFSSALFQLGNRLGDGLPAEIALAKVAKTMEGTTSGEFFDITEKNMLKLGMGLEQALFDSRVGAVVQFPSNVIESSMKVLIESIKKGPRIAAQALLSMARYIKEIHRVEERLKDLMADVISSMKSQIKFLTPSIAGIVIGITSMISTILTKLSSHLRTFSSGQESLGGAANMLTIFGIGIPTFHFQIVVGIYIVQIVFILTILSNGIENGADKLAERFMLGRNIIRSTALYCIIAAIVMVLFNIFAGSILSGSLGA